MCQDDKKFACVPSNPPDLLEGSCKTHASFQKGKNSDVVSAYKIL